MRRNLGQLSETWHYPRSLVVMAALLGLAITLGVVHQAVTKPHYAPLISSMNAEQIERVERFLDERGYRYIVHSSPRMGARVLIDESVKNKAAIELANEGLLNGGEGATVDLCERLRFGVGDRQIGLGRVRVAENALARAIVEGNAAIVSARVMINPGRLSYIQGFRVEPSAMIKIDVRGELSSTEVEGIRRFAAATVDSLRRESVEVVDRSGQSLTTDDRRDVEKDVALPNRMRARLAVEDHIRSVLEDKLSSSVGPDRYHLMVVAHLDSIHPLDASYSRNEFFPRKHSQVFPRVPSYPWPQTIRELSGGEIQELRVFINLDYERVPNSGERVRRSDDAIEILEHQLRSAVGLPHTDCDEASVRWVVWQAIFDE